MAAMSLLTTDLIFWGLSCPHLLKKCLGKVDGDWKGACPVSSMQKQSLHVSCCSGRTLQQGL